MAIYKPSYCYPFSESLDSRIALLPGSSEETASRRSSVYLKCKVNTSNKNVIGYSIRLLDANNNQIFPANDGAPTISPISELQGWNDDIYDGISTDHETNSGMNGTFLKIPFIQSNAYPEMQSFNALYCNLGYCVDYVLLPLGSDGDSSSYGWSVNTDGNYEKTIDGTKIWDGMLNGETAMAGNTVLFITSSESKILVVDSSGVLKPAYTAGGVIGEVTGNIGVDKGSYHGQTITVSKGSTVQYSMSTSIPFTYRTKSGDGTSILMYLTGGQYKWIITLYAGPKIGMSNEWASVIKSVKLSDNTVARYVDPLAIPEKYFDNLITSGNILGTSPVRIQLDPLPTAGTDESPLVLISRWCQLYASDANHYIGSRVYVNSYDSTYGHVYPQEDSYPEDLIDQAYYCSFYKHSNDYNYIEEADIVEYASGETENVDLANSQNITELGGVTGIESGTRVLLRGQTHAQENGVYITSTKARWYRAAPYTTWSAFIGAVIYIKAGTYAGINLSAQANVRGTLYSWSSTQKEEPEWSDYTPLYFFNEEAIKVMSEENITIANGDKYILVSAATTKALPDNGIIDGYTVQGEDLVIKYTRNNSVYTATVYRVHTGDATGFTYTVDTTVGSWDWAFIRFGNANGRRWIYNGDTDKGTTPVYNPWFQVPIGKNTRTQTYISPNPNLEVGQILTPQNDAKVRVGETSADAKEVSSLRINAIDKKTWKITHDKLYPSAMASYSNTDKGIPYVYNIYSAFASSNENPFYLYEQPYLKLSDSVGGDSDVSSMSPYFVTDPGYLKVVATPPELFFVESDTMLSGVGGSSARFEAFYYQGQQRSWESYRWVLRDYAGNIIQDTGKKYDKNMAVTFLGLETHEDEQTYYPDDAVKRNDNRYVATVYVEDDLNNTISLDIDLECKEEGLTTVSPLIKDGEPVFKAEVDCELPAVILSFDPSISPDYEISMDESDNPPHYWNVYRREYGRFQKHTEYQTWHGNWELVKYHCTEEKIRDFGVKSGHSYQYCIMWDDRATKRLFANIVSEETSYYYGKPVSVNFSYWTLVDLKQTNNDLNGAPIVKTTYEADVKNVWFFKYNAEVGPQTHTMAKNEISTLGRFNRVAVGAQNSISGEISCYLGSEIVPLSRYSYIERARKTQFEPISTNDAVAMLELWRKLTSSNTPKLLRDKKGQAWIVQILSDSNTPRDAIHGSPDTISFSWKQIGLADGAVAITGSGIDIEKSNAYNSWELLKH